MRFLRGTGAKFLGDASPLTAMMPPTMAMMPPMIWMGISVACNRRMANTVVKMGAVCKIAADAHTGRRQSPSWSAIYPRPKLVKL